MDLGTVRTLLMFKENDRDSFKGTWMYAEIIFTIHVLKRNYCIQFTIVRNYIATLNCLQ